MKHAMAKTLMIITLTASQAALAADLAQTTNNTKNILTNSGRIHNNTAYSQANAAAITMNSNDIHSTSIYAQANQHMIDNLQQEQQQEKTAIHNNNVHTQANADDIKVNSNRIHNNSVYATANQQAIGGLQREQQHEKTLITFNSAAIKKLQSDMEKMATNMNGAYAESAAFAGLVNPYSVGKFSISAGVGYHGNAEAIAIGLGKRFNEKLTAKLGGAYDTATESTSAYAGVGFEF